MVIKPRPIPYYPCDCSAPAVECAVCGFRNEAGHERRHHRGFVPVITPTGSAWLCVGHGSIGISLAESPAGPYPHVTLMFTVPLEQLPW